MSSKLSSLLLFAPQSDPVMTRRAKEISKLESLLDTAPPPVSTQRVKLILYEFGVFSLARKDQHEQSDDVNQADGARGFSIRAAAPGHQITRNERPARRNV